MGYIGTTIRIHSFISQLTKGQVLTSGQDLQEVEGVGVKGLGVLGFKL